MQFAVIAYDGENMLESREVTGSRGTDGLQNFR